MRLKGKKNSLNKQENLLKLWAKVASKKPLEKYYTLTVTKSKEYGKIINYRAIRQFNINQDNISKDYIKTVKKYQGSSDLRMGHNIQAVFLKICFMAMAH